MCWWILLVLLNWLVILVWVNGVVNCSGGGMCSVLFVVVVV